MIDLSQPRNTQLGDQAVDTHLCDQAVGVFVGEKGVREGLKPRGLVCPLPDFSKLDKYEVVTTRLSLETTFKLVEFMKTFQRVRGTAHKYVSSPGPRTTVYGVFVALSPPSGEQA
jgi:hypothetical protein